MGQRQLGFLIGMVLASCSGGSRETTPSPLDAGPPPRESPIVAENSLPGDSGWQLPSSSKGIWGFSDRASYRPGATVWIHAAAQLATTATWELWRMGYYGGQGGRVVASGGPIEIPAAVPEVLDPETGATRAPWSRTFSILVDQSAVTGVYLVKIVAPDVQTFVFLVIREAVSTAPIAVVIGVNTYQAYNRWGGTSLYNNRREDWSVGQAYAVSFDRPYHFGDGTGLFFYYDQDFVFFAESQGYDIEYLTDVDLDAEPLLGRRMIVIPGHSEYWTREMREHLEEACGQGTNAVFLGANAVYWQTRFQPSWDGRARRVLIGYKEYAGLDPARAYDPARVTTLFREKPVEWAENELIGIMYGEWIRSASPLMVSDEKSWVWAGTDVDNGTSLPGVFGIEVDRRYANGSEPAGLEELGHGMVENHQGELSLGEATLYPTKSGGRVFATGSLTWTKALARAGVWDRRVQQATANIFAVMAGYGRVGELLPIELPPGAPTPAYRAGVEVKTVTSALERPVAVAALPLASAAVIDGSRLVIVSPDGKITPLAGGEQGDADGLGEAAAFREPRGLVADDSGIIYVADTGNNKIRKVSPSGQVVTLAGSGNAGFSDGDGTNAQFSGPIAIARRADGVLLVADIWNQRIRAVNPSGEVWTWAGNGSRDVIDGPGSVAAFYFPMTIAVLPDGSTVVAESDTGLIRRISPDSQHTVSTFLGQIGRQGWADGPVSIASVYETIGVAARSSGESILVDSASSRIRIVTGGVIETLAGGASGQLVDGPGQVAGFAYPRAAVELSDGSLLVVDTGNSALRRISISE